MRYINDVLRAATASRSSTKRANSNATSRRLCVHVVKEHQMFRKREKEYNQSREGARLKSKRIEVALAARPPADMCLPC